MKKKLIGILLGILLVSGFAVIAINHKTVSNNKTVKNTVEENDIEKLPPNNSINSNNSNESNSETAKNKENSTDKQVSPNDVNKAPQEANTEIRNNTTNNNNSGNNTSGNSVNNSSTNESANNTASNDYLSEVEQQIYNLVNEERAKMNISPLSYNRTMEKYARIKSSDMGNRGYFDHISPEGTYITDNMKADGVSYNAWAENIGYLSGNLDTATLANQFMNNWMNSPGHRANILSTNYDSIGVGVYRINGKVYATQEFYK